MKMICELSASSSNIKEMKKKERDVNVNDINKE